MTLRVTLELPTRLPLAEPLVGVARLTNGGSAPVTTSSRLNLVEGDLTLVVLGPDGGERRVLWPYPVDSGLRRVTLAPGEVLEGGVLLLVGADVPGTHQILAEFSPTPREQVSGEPVAVERTGPLQPWDDAAARALAQAVLGAVDLGDAGPALAGTAVGRLLAALAAGNPAAIGAATEEVVAERGSLTAACAATAVVPPGLFPGDPRLEAVAATLGRQTGVAGVARVSALLTEQAFRP
jgi:hypothetical protein